MKTSVPKLKSQRGFVDGNLIFATNLVGDLLPGRGNCISSFLRRSIFTRIALGQLVFRYGVVLEYTRYARLNCCIRVVVTVGV